MQFLTTSIPDVFKIVTMPHNDARGHFARTYCDQEFIDAGLEQPTVQVALSHNTKKGTLRGLHFIPEAHGEAKLVRCVRGSIFDVAVDLRPHSKTFRKWFGLELSAKNMAALYLPRGIAHGFITLTDDADVLYQFSEAHRPGVEMGVAWNDAEIAIEWPLAPSIISERDRTLPMLSKIEHQL